MTRLPGSRSGIRSLLSGWGPTAVVAALTALWTVPTLGLFVTSLRPPAQVATSGWWTFFRDPAISLDNYRGVLLENSFGTSGGLSPYLVNSIAISLPGTIFPVVIAAMAAYALAWVRFRGSDVLFFAIFALQVVPLQLALIPLLQLFSGGVHIGRTAVLPPLGPGGGYWQVWLAHTMFALPLAIFLLHNFIAALPREVMEAAIVDGASHLTTFRVIVLPLAAPALASLAIFQFLWVWNDLLVALTFAGGSPRTSPLTARLSQLSGSFGDRWDLLTAGAFVSMLVPLLVFFTLQRYFVRGLLAGSVKG